MKINSLKRNNAGLELNVFDRFYLSEKSVNLQENNIVSFFVDNDVNKSVIKYIVNKISDDSTNCISVRALNVRPRAHASRTKRGVVNYKLKGKTVNERKKKVYVSLRDVSKFIGGLNKWKEVVEIS